MMNTATQASVSLTPEFIAATEKEITPHWVNWVG